MPGKVSKITIDPNKCISCGTCTVVSPKVFEFTDDGHTKVTSEALKESQETILDGAKACPSGAISVYDENGNQIFPVTKA